MSNPKESKQSQTGRGGVIGMAQFFGQMMMLPMTVMASGMAVMTEAMREMQRFVGQGTDQREGRRSSTLSRVPTSNNNFAREETVTEGRQGANSSTTETTSKEEKGMQILVKFEVFDTIIESERFREAREATHKQLQLMLKSGKVLASGAFSAQRGGFVLLEVDSGEELLRFLAPGFSDNCRIETYPVVPWEKQGEVMAKIFQDLGQ